jgi:hypothetical protein
MKAQQREVNKTWLRRFETIFLLMTGIIVVAISILDFIGVLDDLPWLAKRVPTLTILLISSIASYLILERRNHLDVMQQQSSSTLNKLRDDFHNTISELIQTISDSGVLKPLDVRQNLTEIYRTYFNEANDKIDIIALTSEHPILLHGNNFKEKVETQPCDIRIMILDPESPLWDLRLKDEPGRSRKSIEQIIERSKEFFLKLRNIINPDDCEGSISVRFHNRIPYYAYFRSGNRMVIGLYYAFTYGARSHAIEVLAGSDLFRAFENHFDAMWHGTGTKEIVHISQYSDSQMITTT